MDPSNVDDITQAARRQVLIGLYSQEEILDQLSDVYELPEHATAVVRQLVQTLWSKQLEEQATWPDTPTDVEKLQKAFSRLEDEDHILCRMNFTCCRTCGLAEIGGESEDEHVGYCFFHQQDTEAAAKGFGLTIRYGDFNETATSDESMVDIGRRVASKLREESLLVEWDEDPNKTIRIVPFQWRVRLNQL